VNGIELIAVNDLGKDMLEAVGRRRVGEKLRLSLLDEPATETEPLYEEIRVYGWVSATTNHFDDDAYVTDSAAVNKDPDLANVSDGEPVKQLRPDAKPRAMTTEEIGEYARSLLDAAALQPAPIAFA
jgi:hypothetical protein